MPPSGSVNDALSYADVKYTPVDVSLSGDNSLIPGVAGFKILPVSGLLIADGSVKIKFKSAESATTLTGLLSLIANAGFVLPEVKSGHFETKLGEGLTLNLSAAVQVGGWLVYRLIT